MAAEGGVGVAARPFAQHMKTQVFREPIALSSEIGHSTLAVMPSCNPLSGRSLIKQKGFGHS